MARGSLHHVELWVPGWTLLFPDRHPQAGGPGTYAGCLANADGFEVDWWPVLMAETCSICPARLP